MARIVLSLCICFALAASVYGGNRIIGGTEILIDQVPFAAVFSIITPQGGPFFHTGGVVITSRHILSAAHSFLTDQYIRYVRLGSSFWHSGGVNVLVATAINHPDYSPSTWHSDITVVVLSEPVLIGGGTGISNAILPHPTTILPADMPISVAGWGVTEHGAPSSQLRNVDVFVIDWEVCSAKYANFLQLTTNMFCAGILDVAGMTSCTGDSGGPAYSGGVVYGLVSFGDCGHQLPSVYANVASFIPWIENTVNSSKAFMSNDYAVIKITIKEQ